MISATITGNLAAKPELETTPSGTKLARIVVYSTRRVKDQATGNWVDATTTKVRCTAWNGLAEHAAAELDKGMSVIVKGTLEQRDYTDKQGVQRTSLELTVNEVGRALKHGSLANAQPMQAPQQGFTQYAQPQAAAQSDPWNTQPPADEWGNPDAEPDPEF